jgi:KDO2-lipid IV(A) lauroyltransferase
MYLVLYYIVGYRKKIVLSNLTIAFPEKSEEEKIQIAKKFYHYLADNSIEVLKLLSMSDKHFFRRCVGNFEVVNEVAMRGKSIQLHSGHQFNADYGILYSSKNLILPFYAMYVHMSNHAINRLFLKLRSRYGAVMIEAADFRNKIHTMYKNPYVFGWIADQNPSNPRKAYWLNFFTRPAPFGRAPERSASKNNVAVVFAQLKIIKRGYYYFEYTVITENAADLTRGELTRKYRDFLEESIRADPANYLWTHRRWKHIYKEDYKDLWVDSTNH